MTDFCYSRSMLERVIQKTKLMDAMMQRVGVAPIAAVRSERGVGWYEARTRCIECHHEAICQAWLSRTEHAPSAPDFCVNRDFLDRCQ